MSPLVVLLSLPALSFAPTEADRAFPTGERVYTYALDRQHALRHSPAWQGFVQGPGAGWLARFDEAAGVPLRAWGAPIPLGAPRTGAAAAAAVLDLLAAHEGLLGVPVNTLRLAQARPSAQGGWDLRFDQVAPGPHRAEGPHLEALAAYTAHGQPVVWRGGVVARVRGGGLVQLGVHTVPDAVRLDTRPTLSAVAATSAAVQGGPHPEIQHTPKGAVLVVVPTVEAGMLRSHLAWLVRTETGGPTAPSAPRGRWTTLVDAHTGLVRSVTNQVRHAGQVTAEHDARTVGDPLEVSPMPHLDITGGTTDAEGRHTADGAQEAMLSGPYFTVLAATGMHSEVAWDGGDFLWTMADATQAELDAWVFLHRVREWGARYAAHTGFHETELTAIVGRSSGTCNAYYDAFTIHFFGEGGGCNDAGRIADVAYHEWGHGLHDAAAGTEEVDGTIGEGAADVVATLLTGDPSVAPAFFTSGDALRQVDVERRYPDDVQGAIHEDGLLFAGAMWNLRQRLAADEGDEAAVDTVSSLLVGALALNPWLGTAYDAVLLADDDNGDLSDGTPHQCAIARAFDARGLGPAGTPGVLQLHLSPLAHQPADTAVPVEAELVSFAPGCFDVAGATGTLWFRVDGGDWQDTPLTLDGERLLGTLPGTPERSVVEYFVEVDVETDEGALDRRTSPASGALAPMSYAVGSLTEVDCQDFETDDGGYTHELLHGEDVEGADDWQWGVPQGKAGDPSVAASGLNVWGNDLGGDNWNGYYQNDRINRLTSAPLDVGTADGLVLQYRRWLQVEDVVSDQAIIQVNGTELWRNGGDDERRGHTRDAQWAVHTLRIPDTMLGDDGVLELSWEVHSDFGFALGGWNIDDVCIYRFGEETSDDTGTPTETPTEPEDTGSPDPSADSGDADGARASKEQGGCGCAAGSAGGTAGLALLVALGAVGRRRR